MINGRLIGLGIFLVVVLLLAIVNSARAEKKVPSDFLSCVNINYLYYTG
jgi:hypothetical protein